MIGIYKIINPKGRVYIGQSIRIATRKEDYSKLRDCKGQQEDSFGNIKNKLQTP
jgi:hypothetical protein